MIEDKETLFEFEKYICNEKTELWKNEAYNLFSSAKVLLEFETILLIRDDNPLDGIFPDSLTKYGHWFYRIIRMLWGYGFENVLKGIIIKGNKENNPDCNEVPIQKIKSHNLSKLFKDAKIEISENELFYINIIEKCSVWMGRYPLPVKFEQMYDQREPMNSSEELIARSIELHKKYMNGEIPRTFCESDVLHSSIGYEEKTIIMELINKVMDKI